MKIRMKCPHCGEAFNVNVNLGVVACPKCKNHIESSQEGKIYLYRQGSVYGVAGSFGIYLNGQPYGHIGNKELLCFPLPYGTYNIHSAVGMSRKCRDLQVTHSPDAPEAYTNVYIRPGFWTNNFVVEPMDPTILRQEGHL